MPSAVATDARGIGIHELRLMERVRYPAIDAPLVP